MLKALKTTALCAALGGAALLATACGGSAPRPDGAASASIPDLGPIDRTRLPEAPANPSWAPPEVATWTMPGGVTVYHLKQGQAPLASAALIFPRGAATDPVGKAGLTMLTADMLDEGAEGMDAFAIAEGFQRMATDYSAYAGTDAVTVELDCLAENLNASLGMVSNVLRTATFPEAEFERRKAQALAQALAQEAQPGYGATVVMRRVLFGEGYGGFPPSGTRTTLQAITLDDVKAHAKGLFQPEGMSVVVVGNVTRDVVEGALNEHFGAWRGQPAAAPQVVPARTAARGIYFVDYPGAPQSVVSVARVAPGFEASARADYFKALVFNWTLGGAFTSRVNMNLREDKGYTYGARSVFNRWRRIGFYQITARVKSETTRASLDEIFKELKGITGDKPVSAEEHTQATGGLLLGYPGRFEDISSVAGQIARLPLHGLSTDWLAEWPDKVKAVSLEEARAMAAKYGQADDFKVFVAGDKASVAPTLEGLGMPIFYYDAQGNPL